MGSSGQLNITSMKKILLLIAVILCYNLGYAQGVFTSSPSGDAGNWNASGTWTLASGSDDDTVPDADDTVTISSGDVVTVTSGNAAAATTLTVTGTLVTEAALTISGNVTASGSTTLNGGNVVVSGDFTNSGTLKLFAGSYLQLDDNSKTLTNTGAIEALGGEDSFSRIIVAGTITDSGGSSNKYQRWINGTGDAGTSTGWDLIGVPTSNTSIETTIDGNTDIASSGSGTSILYGVGFYDGTDNSWETYGGSATSEPYADAGNFTVGKGYQMAADIPLNGYGAAIEFDGNLNTGDINYTTLRNYDLDDDSDMSDGSRFNLLANPYVSFLNVGDNAHATNNLIDVNTNVLHTNGQCLYMWDGDSYVTIDHNTSTSYQYLPPYTGFMVMAKTTGSNTTFSFTKVMQTTSGSNDPIADSNIMDPLDIAELFIGISQNGKNRHTEIYFNEIGVDGLTPGYDSQAFPNAYPSISTRLIETIESTEGINFATQSLAYSEMWDKVIPLVVNAEAGSEVVLDINHNTTPADLKIYLEDAVEGTFTNLKENNFVISPSENLEGAGRFYIHTTENALSNEEVNTSLLNAYKEVGNNYITIEGLATQVSSTEVSLFNILGTKVMDTMLDNTTNTQTVSTNGLSTGIYVLKLVSGENQLTKKLIIK